MSDRVMATPAALEAIARLRAAHGPLAFFQSGGCCDGSSPMCLRADELPPGSGDVEIGAIDGVPFYIDAEQDERWLHPRLEIDVAPGPGDSFSLEGSYGLHFVATTRP